MKHTTAELLVLQDLYQILLAMLIVYMFVTYFYLKKKEAEFLKKEYFDKGIHLYVLILIIFNIILFWLFLPLKTIFLIPMTYTAIGVWFMFAGKLMENTTPESLFLKTSPFLSIAFTGSAFFLLTGPKI